MSPENGKQPKHLDAEQSQAEHMGRRGQARGKHRRCHQRGIRGKGGREFRTHGSAVIEEEDVDAHEPGAQRPDGILAGRFGQRFKDGGKPQERAVNESGRLGGGKTRGGSGVDEG